jgi:hypothetical protein
MHFDLLHGCDNILIYFMDGFQARGLAPILSEHIFVRLYTCFLLVFTWR